MSKIGVIGGGTMGARHRRSRRTRRNTSAGLGKDAEICAAAPDRIESSLARTVRSGRLDSAGAGRRHIRVTADITEFGDRDHFACVKHPGQTARAQISCDSEDLTVQATCAERAGDHGPTRACARIDLRS